MTRAYNEPTMHCPQHGYNYCHICTRHVDENAFGHLKGRFCVLKQGKLSNPHWMMLVSKVCCALRQNWCTFYTNCCDLHHPPSIYAVKAILLLQVHLVHREDWCLFQQTRSLQAKISAAVPMDCQNLSRMFCFLELNCCNWSCNASNDDAIMSSVDMTRVVSWCSAQEPFDC